jgi:outer membrane receptor protein involved in Fe transport
MFNGVPVDYIEVFVNRNKQKNYGGSLQLNWRHYFGQVRMNAYASFSYVNGVIQDGSGKDLELDFIAHNMGRIGADVKIGSFSLSPRLLLMGRQQLTGIAETDGNTIERQSIPGYQLLNISARYQVSKRFAVFANATNALNQEYRNVSFNMDLTKTSTELFYGQHQDPIRIMGGINVSL